MALKLLEGGPLDRHQEIDRHGIHVELAQGEGHPDSVFQLSPMPRIPPLQAESPRDRAFFSSSIRSSKVWVVHIRGKYSFDVSILW